MTARDFVTTLDMYGGTKDGLHSQLFGILVQGRKVWKRRYMKKYKKLVNPLNFTRADHLSSEKILLNDVEYHLSSKKILLNDVEYHLSHCF